MERVHVLRMDSLYEAIPLTYTQAVRDRLESMRREQAAYRAVSKSARWFRSRLRSLTMSLGLFRGKSSKSEAKSIIHQHNFGADELRFKLSNAKLRIDMHNEWEIMYMSLSNDLVKDGARKVQQLLRDDSVYIGASITKPRKEGRGTSRYVPGRFDAALDALREVAVLELT